MMRRALLLLCFLTLPLKGHTKEEPAAQCEMLLENYGSLQRSAQVFHNITVGHDFKIYFGQGSAPLFKAVGLVGLTQTEFEALHAKIVELPAKQAKKKDMDYALRLYVPKKRGNKLISELTFKAPPIFARGLTDMTRKQFEDYLRQADVDFDQMQPQSIEGYHLSVHLKSHTRISLYLSAVLHDGQQASIEIGAYQSCRHAMGIGEDIEPIRTREGWLCTVPILRFNAPEIQVESPVLVAPAVSSAKH